MGPTTVNAKIGRRSFSALVDTGAAKSYISEHVRRILHKVLTPPADEYYFRPTAGRPAVSSARERDLNLLLLFLTIFND